MDSANCWYYILCHPLQQWLLTLSGSQTSFENTKKAIDIPLLPPRPKCILNSHVSSSQPMDKLTFVLPGLWKTRV